jgi:integrase
LSEEQLARESEAKSWRESWDPKEGSIAPKTRTSARTTPMPEAARVVLAELRSHRTAVPDSALAYAADDGSPFHAASIYRRADRAWEAAGIAERLRLHQARHTYASLMIAAGVNARPFPSSWAIPRSR